MDLQALKEKYQGISSNWNGDDSGIQEDKARSAEDIVDLINEIEREKEEWRGLLEQIDKDQAKLTTLVAEHEATY